MKKSIFIITMLVFSLLVAKGFANSPVTTADVYKAYMDLTMVEVAIEEGNLNDDILRFLSDEKKIHRRKDGSDKCPFCIWTSIFDR